MQQSKNFIVDKNLWTQAEQLISQFSSQYLLITDELIYERYKHFFSFTKNLLILKKQVKANLDNVEFIIKKAQKIAVTHLVVFGSGTLNDVTKYAAYKLNLSYLVFASAPSMNGYLAANASLHDGISKKTFTAKQVQYAFFDVDILSEAPLRLIKSGLGDSLASITIKLDWLLAKLLLDEKYAPDFFTELKNYEQQLFANIPALLNRDKQQISNLTYLLIIAGQAMTDFGSSAPASQAEHILAHLYEMNFPEQAEQFYHGEQIAVTTLYMLRLQQKFLYNAQAPQLKALQLNFFAKEQTEQKLKNLWSEISAQLNEAALDEQELIALYEAANLPKEPEDLGWSVKQLDRLSKDAQLYRERFTFLNLSLN